MGDGMPDGKNNESGLSAHAKGGRRDGKAKEMTLGVMNASKAGHKGRHHYRKHSHKHSHKGDGQDGKTDSKTKKMTLGAMNANASKAGHKKKWWPFSWGSSDSEHKKAKEKGQGQV